MSKHFSGIIRLAIILILVFGPGCSERVNIGPLETESKSVEVGRAESVRAEITMGAGKLKVAGGADQLFEGEFTYNVPEWRPEVTYSVKGSKGKLVIEQPEMLGLNLGRRMRNEWDLRLKDDVPMNLSIGLGAGSNYLELGSLSLSRLDIQTGAGEVEVDLTGSPSVSRLDVEAGAGDVTVDLTGHWEGDLVAHIKGGIGRITLRLPYDVGVRVNAEKGIGKISASGLTRKGKAYVNGAYGESDVTLQIEVETGIGKINLELSGYGTTI